jgi:glutamine synthetase
MATNMVISPQEVASAETLERVAREGVRLIDLQFSDIAGGARVMTIPGDLLPSVLRNGYRFDGSAVTGGQRELELDLFLAPDPATLVTYVEPSGVGRRARFTCSVRRRDGQPFAGDPRSVLERNPCGGESRGFDYRIAVELEYYLFNLTTRDYFPPPDAAGYFGTGLVSAQALVMTLSRR